MINIRVAIKMVDERVKVGFGESPVFFSPV